MSGSGHVGVDRGNPHLYTARAGLFDVDYLGHMNNAAYLTHGELARWEMCVANGIMDQFLQHRIAPVVTSAVVRYRREVKPLFRKFQINTTILSITPQSLLLRQDFRHYKNNNKKDDKLRTQLLIQNTLVDTKTGSIVNPIEFLVDTCAADPTVIDQLIIQQEENNYHDDDGSNTKTTIPTIEEEEMEKYLRLEASLRQSAQMDDERLRQQQQQQQQQQQRQQQQLFGILLNVCCPSASCYLFGRHLGFRTGNASDTIACPHYCTLEEGAAWDQWRNHSMGNTV